METNYKKVGLKCGLEVHQQLNTEKLFCNCPSILREDAPDVIIERKQQAVAGETGKIDLAAAYEQQRSRTFIYQAYSNTTCLIELDEEPPKNLNQQALFTALQISLLLNAQPLKTTQVMRKTVIDGSNTSGFQRTLLIAKDGFIQTQQGKVNIQSICLEEDAARIIKQEKNSVTYRLDRLGIPLIEIATAPDIKTPEQAKETAAKLGEILRATNIKRGLGTIRQDINLSIKNNPRVEIKGVQKLNHIPKIIENEIQRQLTLKKPKEEVRKALPNTKSEFLRPLPGAARMYPETDLELIHISPKLLKQAKTNLPKLREHHLEKLKKLHINDELAKQLIKENKHLLLENLMQNKNIRIPPEFMAKTLLNLKAIKAHHKVSTEKITQEDLEKILEAFSKNKIQKDTIETILIEIAKGKDAEKTIKQHQGKAPSQTELKKTIKTIIDKHADLSEKAIMGIAMQQLRNKANGADVAKILKELMK